MMNAEPSKPSDSVTLLADAVGIDVLEGPLPLAALLVPTGTVDVCVSDCTTIAPSDASLTTCEPIVTGVPSAETVTVVALFCKIIATGVIEGTSAPAGRLV